MGRLEYGNADHDTSEMSVLVTSFGRPVENLEIGVQDSTSFVNEEPWLLPLPANVIRFWKIP